VEGSAALALVVSGVVFGELFMIAALSSVALSPEDAASVVVALGFFFVMLQELKNANAFTFICLVYDLQYFPTPRLANSVVDPRCRVQGYDWMGLLDGYAYQNLHR
jgi:hypothetical protein